MRPATGGAWQPLTTQFDGQHLLARFDDSQLAPGPYEFQATSCDQVGNCASTVQTLTLPVRVGSVSSVSLARIADPARAVRVRERVRVGWHLVTVKRHHRRVRIKRGGYFRRITVIRLLERCSRERVRVSRHRWREIRACHPPRLVLTSTERVRYGHSVIVHGVLTTSQGVPLPGQTIRILTAPANGQNQFTQATVATTAPDGSWTVTLAPGPSRIIQGAYDGTPTVAPASGQATVTVPAKVKLIRVSPKQVPWGGTVRITGQLEGGYLPAGGALLRLRIGYRSSYSTYGVQTHVTGNGRFTTNYTFGPNNPAIHESLWFQVASLPMGSYPFAPAASARRYVLVGGHPLIVARQRRQRRE